MRLPYTWYVRVYHTLLGRLSVVDISMVGIVRVAKRWAVETCPQELFEDVSLGIGTLLVVEQSGLENGRGGV